VDRPEISLSVVPVLEKYDTLRAIWGDILQGFSFCEEENIYVKHLGDMDHCRIAKIKEKLIQKYLKMGVPTRQERLDIIWDQEWNQDDEDEIVSHEYFIIDNEPTLQKLKLPKQREFLQKKMDETKLELARKRQEKENKIGVCAETKAEKLANNYYIYFALYKDEDCKEKLWDKEEFDEIDDRVLVKYIVMYNRVLSIFNQENFRQIAVMPFVLNIASYCKDQGEFFYGKPITEFSNYQLSVFTKVMRNTFILRESKGHSPDLTGELMMQDLLDWYDMEYNMIMAGTGAEMSTTHSGSSSMRGRSMTT
jgi:hypothetical protein